MNSIQAEGQNCAKKLEIETIKNVLYLLKLELTKKIDKLERMITNQKNQDIKINESDEILQLLKKTKAYEYKLDNIKQKHNEGLAEIRRL